MEFVQKSINQGVTVNYGITNKFKSSYLSVDFILPLTIENATGMSLLAGVMSRGCKAYPQMDLIGRYLAKNYGASLSINAGKAGEMEIFTVSANFLNDEFAIDGEFIYENMIAFLEELIFSPLVTEKGFYTEIVDQEKKNLSNKMAALFNDKRLFSLERCKALMCADESFGINEMGDEKTLQSFDAETLYAFYNKMISDAMVVISYVGKQRDLADTFVQNLCARKEFEVQSAIKTVDQAKEIVEPMNLNQSKLNLGFRLGENAAKNGAACRLFNVLYGGSANSKLFMNVRERLSLCYYCSSTIDRFKNVMFVSSGIESEKYEQARNEIEAQLQAIADGDFNDEEFNNAKVYLIDSIRGSYDSKSAVAAAMVSSTLRGEQKNADREIEEIAAVSREDVISIARETRLDTVYFLKGVQTEE